MHMVDHALSPFQLWLVSTSDTSIADDIRYILEEVDCGGSDHGQESCDVQTASWMTVPISSDEMRLLTGTDCKQDFCDKALLDTSNQGLIRGFSLFVYFTYHP